MFAIQRPCIVTAAAMLIYADICAVENRQECYQVLHYNKQDDLGEKYYTLEEIAVLPNSR